MLESAPLRKMSSHTDGRVHYTLTLNGERVELDRFIGEEFTMKATGALSCVVCGRPVRKLFGQGYCFPCLQSAPEAAECILRPELCRAHLGEGRDPAWEREHHHTEHTVYLSYTGGIKVGVTRSTQVPTRWVDQGAVAAVVIARVPYRHLAGLIEVELKRSFADRTNWRAMLKEVPPDADALLEARTTALAALPPELAVHGTTDESPMVITYPVLAYPPKVTSVSLEKTPEVSGRLLGVKGQYLIWEDGRVLNVRSHSGVHVLVSGNEVTV